MSEPKKSPIPFEKIAVAVAFSPRYKAIIAEAVRLSQVFSARLHFIHVGKNETETRSRLTTCIRECGMAEGAFDLIVREGDPVEVIIDICKKERVDLLVAGALEKENIFKYYIGSVARKMIRQAKCSVLMLTEPSVNPKPFRRLVINGLDHPKTSHTIGAAVYVAQKEACSDINIVKESPMYGFAMMMSEDVTETESKQFKRKFIEEETRSINAVLSNLDLGALNVKTKILTGKPGYEISHFARTNQADLLVVNSPDNQHGIIDRVFPHDIEYALADLPCSLLTVHSRV